MKHVASVMFLLFVVVLAGCALQQKHSPEVPLENSSAIEKDKRYRLMFEEVCSNLLGVRIEQEVDARRREVLEQKCFKLLGVRLPEVDSR
jgi:thioredoxin-related protein